MAEENIYRKFVQFDGTNWNSWKFRVNVLLEEKELAKYLEESLDDILKETIDDEDELKCIKEEKKCKSILVQCVADTHLEYVQDKKRVKDMYDSLKAVYERKSVAGQLFLRKKLITMKYEETDDMADHFLKFDKTVRELKAIGATLEDLDITCHLLLSLPKSYDNLVTALETLDPDKLDINFVKSRLLDEFTKRNQFEGHRYSKSNSSVAMNANANGSFKFKCYRCQKFGHKWSECEANVDTEKAKRNELKIEKNPNVAAKYSDSEGSDEEIPVAFSVFDKSSAAEECMKRQSSVGPLNGMRQRIIKFFLDSAATSHMVNDRTVMANLKKIFVEKVRSAKKGVTISASESGGLNGVFMYEGKKTECNLKDVLYMKDLSCNLMSIGKMQKAGMEIHFKDGAAHILFKNKLLYVANRCGDTYQVELLVEEKQFAGICSEKKNTMWKRQTGQLKPAKIPKFDSRREMINYPVNNFIDGERKTKSHATLRGQEGCRINSNQQKTVNIFDDLGNTQGRKLNQNISGASYNAALSFDKPNDTPISLLRSQAYRRTQVQHCEGYHTANSAQCERNMYWKYQKGNKRMDMDMDVKYQFLRRAALLNGDAKAQHNQSSVNSYQNRCRRNNLPLHDFFGLSN